MNRVLDGSEIHGAGRWRWPFLVAITVLLLCGGLAVLQYTRFADAATQVEHTEAGDRAIDGVKHVMWCNEPDAREVVQRLLEDAGARVKTAATASDAMVTLEQGFLPDIIVSDIGMPDQDGYDFMKRVRRMDGAVAGVPAAALTALARVEDRKRALMAGYQTHLAKPVDPAELVAVVASLTGRTGRPMA
jgi:CheY-like chemotaxis protein